MPFNGLVAYVAAVYVWLTVGRLDPILLLVVPLFHSLQYSAVVVPVSAQRRRSPGGARLRGRGPCRRGSAPRPPCSCASSSPARSSASRGFWVAPVLFDAFPSYDQAVFGPTAALFIAWTFINIHHYFLDNVTWRRENPETRRHLFGGTAR